MSAFSVPRARPPGLVHAAGPDGRDLPVIDVSHPAFAVSMSEAELAALTAADAEALERRNRLPRWLRRWLFRLLLRKSTLARGLREAEGGFLDGLSTYLLKLGPDNLDLAWATPIDRKIAASLPCLSLRLRLQDMAELLATDLALRLTAHPGKCLHLVNIAGGPSMDSLNAVILLQRRHADLLHDRIVCIHVLDQDEIGPAFASRALAALSSRGAPLAGVKITLTHTPYRWDDPARLRGHLAQLPPDAVTAVSSEGGLFEYGSDEEIVLNLQVLREGLRRDTVVAGSVTRGDRETRRRQIGPRFATQPRELPAFEQLVKRAGWTVDRSLTRPFSFNVRLRPEGPSPDA